MEVKELKVGQVLRYTGSLNTNSTSLWILLSEEEGGDYWRKDGSIQRRFRLYGYYDSAVSLDKDKRYVEYDFNYKNINDFSIEVQNEV